MSAPAALAVILLGAALTWSFVRSTQWAASTVVQRTLDQRALQIETHIAQSLLTCEALLEAGVGFVDVTWPLTLDEWRTFAKSLRPTFVYPGVQGFGFAGVVDRLTPEQIAELKTPASLLQPSDIEGKPTAILYLEPLDARNRAAIGFDMMSEPVRREAMQRARDAGAPALSGKVTLVQEIDAHIQPGFLMYLPVYERDAALREVEDRRAALIGFVYSPFRAGDFLNSVLRQETPDVQLEVYDGTQANPAALLYARGEKAADGSELARTRLITIGGHTWTLQVSASDSLVKASERFPAWLIVAIGGVGTFLLAGLVFTMSRSRQILRERLEIDERLLEQERDAATILENSLEAFIVIDEQDGILEWNRQAASIFGWSKEEILGRRLADLIVPARLRQAHVEAILRFHSREHTLLGRRVEMPAMRRDGTEILVELSIATVVRRSERVFFASLKDVTARKHQEEQVRLLNATLEQRVAERTHELERANRDLEAFTRSVSHDLRAPLRIIKGYSGLLAEDLGSTITPAVQRDLDAITHTVQRTESIVDNLLRLASVGQRQLRTEEVSLEELATRVVEELHPPPSVQVHLLSNELGCVHADPGLLTLALRNLIANAIKFSQVRAAPQIWIGAQDVEGGRAYYVKDNGVGFNPEYSNKLFGAFQRLHTDREFEGIGLGLTIVKSVVEKHGGRVWAESAPGEGATFYFVLPERPGQRQG